MSVSRDKLNGFLLIDKAKGRPSFSSIFRVRQCFGRDLKVGHLGTLDPLATGLLIVAVGEATKLTQYLMGFDKTYRVKVCFGAVSNTYDADGNLEATNLPENFKLTEQEIKKAIEQKFSSKIMQVPPAFSAKWVDGKRAYHLARKGHEVTLEPVEVTIHSFKLLSFDYPEAEFEIAVSSGTYIRSLIHDLGRELGCGAYIKDLRRTKVGDFAVEDAVCDVDGKALNAFLTIEKVVNKKFKRIDLDDEEKKILSVGRKLENRRAFKDGIYSAYHGGKLEGVLEVKSLPLPGCIEMVKTLHLLRDHCSFCENLYSG